MRGDGSSGIAGIGWVGEFQSLMRFKSSVGRRLYDMRGRLRRIVGGELCRVDRGNGKRYSTGLTIRLYNGFVAVSNGGSRSLTALGAAGGLALLAVLASRHGVLALLALALLAVLTRGLALLAGGGLAGIHLYSGFRFFVRARQRKQKYLTQEYRMFGFGKSSGAAAGSGAGSGTSGAGSGFVYSGPSVTGAAALSPALIEDHRLGKLKAEVMTELNRLLRAYESVRRSGSSKEQEETMQTLVPQIFRVYIHYDLVRRLKGEAKGTAIVKDKRPANQSQMMTAFSESAYFGLIQRTSWIPTGTSMPPRDTRLVNEIAMTYPDAAAEYGLEYDGTEGVGEPVIDVDMADALVQEIQAEKAREDPSYDGTQFTYRGPRVEYGGMGAIAENGGEDNGGGAGSSSSSSSSSAAAAMGEGQGGGRRRRGGRKGARKTRKGGRKGRKGGRKSTRRQ